jgi:hypothetical protein
MARRSRARSGTFFLRKEQDTNGTTYAESSIDVSSFVNVLEGELLRVKQIWFSWTSDNGDSVTGTDVRASGAVQGASAIACVNTQSQTAIKGFSDNSLMGKNTLYAHVDSTANIDMITNETSVNPVDFDDGYLVATDGVFLGVNQNATDSWAANIRCSIMLECEIVKLSLTDAQAVLVSQTVG